MGKVADGGAIPTSLMATVSPDGGWLITDDREERTHLWDTKTGKRVRTLAAAGRATSATVSADNRYVVGSCHEKDEHPVVVWDAITGKALHTLKGHRSYVRTPIISPDGSSLLCVERGDDEKGVRPAFRLWDLAAGRELGSHQVPDMTDIHSAAFSPDGTQFVTAGYAGRGRPVVQVWSSPATGGTAIRSPAPAKPATKPSPGEQPSGAPLDGIARARIGDLKVIQATARPMSSKFSFAVEGGKVADNGVGMWFSVGNPAVMKQLGQSFDGKPESERLGLLSLGNARQGWFAAPCWGERLKGQPGTFVATVSLPDYRPGGDGTAVSFVLFDASGRASNQIDAVVNFETGKLVGDPKSVPFESKPK